MIAFVTMALAVTSATTRAITNRATRKIIRRSKESTLTLCDRESPCTSNGRQLSDHCAYCLRLGPLVLTAHLLRWALRLGCLRRPLISKSAALQKKPFLRPTKLESSTPVQSPALKLAELCFPGRAF